MVANEYQGLDGQALLYIVDGSGNLVPVSPSNPIPADLVGVESVTLTASSVTADTELPAAAALADAAANPTTPTVGSGILIWNGSGWDRVRGDIANGVDVDVTRVAGTVTVDSELPAARVATSTANAIPTAPDVNAVLQALGSGGTTLDLLKLQAGGALRVALEGASGTAIGQTTPASDTVSTASVVLDALAFGLQYNGSNWERRRGNWEATVLTSAARVATTNGADQTNYNGRGAVIALDVTATPNNAETLTVEVQFKDLTSSKYVTVTAFTALVASALGASPATETYIYTVAAGAAETAAVAHHEVQALQLPRVWRFRVVHSAGSSWTYSVSVAAVV